MFETITNFVGGYEWVWILVIAGVFIFGAKKIPELARTMGKAKGDYEKGRIESEKDLKEFKDSLKSKSESKPESK